ncbi:MAG: sulfatase-like hydrolase/transferase [Verrucomicrobiota bacterium]
MKSPLLLALLSITLALPANDRPNLVFLFTDDQRDNTFGAMGHPFVKTPHVDALIGDSVRFTNCYTAEPVCAPSRVSIFTGMHERIHGIGFTSSYDLTEAQWERTYPARLRAAGYHTGFVGKFGVEYYTFRGNAADKFDYWWGHDGWTRFLPKTHDSESTRPYHHAENDVITAIMGEAMAEFLEQRPDDQPFCLSVSFNVPHGSQTTSMHWDYPDWRLMSRPANENPDLQGSTFYDSLYRDLNIRIPEETGNDPYQFIPQFIMDQDSGRRNQTYPYSYTVETNREHHVRYYQTVTGLDHIIGAFREDLARRGLAENTIILYGSDHGLLMGEHAMGGKSLLYDLASKIPSFLHDPTLPQDRRGIELDDLVSSLDFPVTLLDYAGIEALDYMTGQSLRPLIHGEEIEWRQRLFLQSLYTGRDTPFQEGLRDGKWKYIRMFDGAKPSYVEADVDFAERKPAFEMLFDLEADPKENVNLIEEKEGSKQLEEFRSWVAAQSEDLNRQRDTYREIVEIKKREPRKKSFVSLFNGKDLTGWDGDPNLWKVENGIVIGTCEGPDHFKNNTFLIWRGGTVRDFELEATMRVIGDNNSGIQYRSRELQEAGPWVISGYQCDVHPAIEHTGMTYEEKGRGIFGLNGRNVLLDPERQRWLLSEHEPVKVDVSKWQKYTVIARGNHLTHQVGGQVTSELIDHDVEGRSLEGLLAVQLHWGNANRVEIRSITLRHLDPVTEIAPFDADSLPATATQIERPRTANPQGTGPAASRSTKNSKP